MKTVKKILILVSVLCYLVVASVAAVHAYPAMSDAVADSSTLASGSGLDDQPNCHESRDMSPDSAASGLCKIFCSAIGHAMTTDTASEVISLVPLVQVSTLSGSIVTRQLSVEQQPPR